MSRLTIATVANDAASRVEVTTTSQADEGKGTITAALSDEGITFDTYVDNVHTGTWAWGWDDLFGEVHLTIDSELGPRKGT